MKKFLFTALAAYLCSALRVYDNPGSTVIREFQTDDGPITLIVGAKQGRAYRFGVPKPFEVKSKPFRVNVEGSDSNRRGRQIQTFTIDEEGVPVIEGVRVPDDPNDKRVFRNARVINNVLIADEDNAQNQISEDKRFSSRQGRIMTGSSSSQSDSPTEYIQSPNLRQEIHYDTHRKGPVETNVPSPSPSQQEEKIVSYSYSTSVDKGEKKTSPRDVVYGSGFASHPPKKRENSSPTAPTFDAPPFSFPSAPKAPNTHSVSFQQPSITWSDFHSSSDQPPNFQSNLWSYPSPSSSQFKFPSPNPSPSFERSPTPSGNKNFNNHIEQSSQGQYKPGDDFSNWAAHIERHQQNQQRPQGNFYSPHLNSPPVQSNHIRRHHQPEIPTPHHAFGQAGQNLIHPNIIPVNPQNFVVEEATFQTRPGTPAFTLPVPRPASQVHHVQQPQVQQQYYTQPNNYYQGPYQYDYYEELDNRPLIDKMIDPLRKVGQKVKQSLIKPVLVAGQKFGNRLRIPERVDKIASGNVDADALPLVGGAVAVATLGALGAYAASKYSFTDFRNLLPTAATRSTKSNANVQDILLKLANDLEKEDPSFIERFTSSTSWLESSCAQRIFCTLVTTTMREEEEKIQKENVKKEFEKRLKGDKEKDPGEGLQSRIAPGEELESRVAASEEELQSRISPGEELESKVRASEEELQSREARKFLDREVGYLEKQMNNLINSLKVDISGGKNKALRQAANEVVEAVKNKNCSAFTCTAKH